MSDVRTLFGRGGPVQDRLIRVGIPAGVVAACCIHAFTPLGTTTFGGFALDVVVLLLWARVRSAVARLPVHVRDPWRLVSIGMALWLTGDVAWDVLYVLSGSRPDVSIADIAYLAGYPTIAIGVFRLLRLRSPHGDREGALDALGVTVSATMAAWQFLIQPARDGAASKVAQSVAAAYPVADVLLLAVVCFLAFAPGRRSNALRLLVAFGASTLALDIGYSMAATLGRDGLSELASAFYPVAYLFLAQAVNHPDVLEATEPVHVQVHRTNPARFVLLGAILYSVPIFAFLHVRTDFADIVFGLVGSAALTALVITRFVLLVRERERMEEHAAHQSLHDGLTGLANRQLLLQRIEFARGRHVRNGRSFALLFIDLDRFKTVNDTWGHAAGNRVLEAVAAALQRCVRPSDLVARVGGDEFAVLCEDLTTGDVAYRIADRAVAALAKELPVEAKLVAASIGVAVIGHTDAEAIDAEDVLHRADLAMVEAKRDGGRSWRVFDDDLKTWSLQRQSIEMDLTDAIERKELRLEYQPIVTLDHGRCAGFEALLRWDRPGRTPVSPAEFIPVAEATGLIIPIGQWVMQEASRFAAVLASGYVTVNVSAIQLKRSNVAESFRAALNESGADPKRLVIELTESALVTEVDHVDRILANLVDLGARIAVDDFGTGYSSLGYIDRFPVSIVKVDRSLVDRVDEDESQRAVVRAISGLAASLGFTVVAEGIERESQRLALIDLNVHFGQGWLFSRSLRPADAMAFLARTDTVESLAPRVTAP